MKKTLLSIMTMAILASGSAYAQPLNKDISVSAEVHSNISLDKATGGDLNNIDLKYDVNSNDGTHTFNEQIKIQASGGVNRIKVALLEDFTLENGNNQFTNHSISIGGKILQSPVALFGPINQFFDLANGDVTLELIMSAKEPKNAPAGVYSGTAKLVIEESI
ncbi:TPA: hypothetical protein PXJ58_003806 [Yersinia enterocolitica]|uniref:CS1 type fimbrial major subunit n=1 Tax=Yersinia enterocolitica TaxID=630 RepID=UPI001C8E9C23|nr:CS1 type fimbrial major subunit [Yersinia enterocolitica]EKN5090236.1 hypothetical protein [Yersinia enterocolitica]EKN6366857.1 hypothetical protein [Yersinia enterocolitica]MBX9480376.1 hypothetical protein [Yersinia enterocolitica]HDL6739799.1 hypothetical protein [Yersinia enterocolitica]HDU2653084.1 hypothetical protein [Yersinia enterocolitica]